MTGTRLGGMRQHLSRVPDDAAMRLDKLVIVSETQRGSRRFVGC